jgi:hypothetical protein
VDVFMPLPKPVITLPAIKWPKEKAEHCKAAPTTMIAEPLERVSNLSVEELQESHKKIIFLRPRISPIKMVIMAPMKHPTL